MGVVCDGGMILEEILHSLKKTRGGLGQPEKQKKQGVGGGGAQPPLDE